MQVHKYCLPASLKLKSHDMLFANVVSTKCGTLFMYQPTKQGLCTRTVYPTRDISMGLLCIYVACGDICSFLMRTISIIQYTFSISCGENTLPAGFFTIRTSAPVGQKLCMFWSSDIELVYASLEVKDVGPNMTSLLITSGDIVK